MTPLGKGTPLSAVFSVFTVLTLLSVYRASCLGGRGTGFRSWICFEITV